VATKFRCQKVAEDSGGTLQNFRIKGILPFKKIGGIFYYAQADIDKMLDEMGMP